MLISQVKQTYQQIPFGIKIFAKKALILFTAWMLLYYLLLQPTRVPDKWLTATTTACTVNILNSFYKTGFTSAPISLMKDNGRIFGNEIIFNNNPALFIADSCNAFDLYILYISFFVCLPITFRRAFAFSIAGISGIFVLNIMRCYALTWLELNKPSWVNFAHHYAFTLIVYSFIFTLWVVYAKKYKPANVE